jgi:uridylate kinase
MVFVISLGGSLVVPDVIDTSFVALFRESIGTFLDETPNASLVLVTGGGNTARKYQQAYRLICKKKENAHQDWIGIQATRLNGELLRWVFSDYCGDPVVTDPTSDFIFSGRVLVAAGWKPGFSTDFDAVILAERFGAKTIINLSNIAKIYTDDPKKNKDAVPIDTISWDDFQNLTGKTWSPGANVPFDPIASRQAGKMGLRVIAAAGKDLDNTINILKEKKFTGTVIGP